MKINKVLLLLLIFIVLFLPGCGVIAGIFQAGLLAAIIIAVIIIAIILYALKK